MNPSRRPTAALALLLLACVLPLPALSQPTPSQPTPMLEIADLLERLDLKDVELRMEGILGGALPIVTIFKRDGGVVEFDYRHGNAPIHFVGREFRVDQRQGVLFGQGSVHITSGTAFLFADRLDYLLDSEIVKLKGNVKIGNSNYIISGGETGLYDIAAGTGEILPKEPQGLRVEIISESGRKSTGRAARGFFRMENGQLGSIDFEKLTLQSALPPGTGAPGEILSASPHRPSASPPRPPGRNLAD